MTSDPNRLAVVGATDLERRLLEAAGREQPSPELTARMASAIGVAPPGSAPAPPPAPAPAAAAKSLTSWLAAGAIAVAAATGAITWTLAKGTDRNDGPVPAVSPPPAPAPAPAPVTPSAAPAPSPAATPRVDRPRRRSAAMERDLADQIALVDAARSAVGARQSARALVLLRRYEASYPTGAFRPEVAALRVEALEGLGRTDEARAAARSFLARYPDSPLADRLARVTSQNPASASRNRAPASGE